MSLQGTFDTLSVTELFGLLATAGKTGALRLEAGEHDAGPFKASVFVTGGLCCAVESDDAHGPAGSEPELASRLVDVGFSLARCHSGSFRFNDAESPPFDVVATTRLEPAVAEIAALLEQWREIEAQDPVARRQGAARSGAPDRRDRPHRGRVGPARRSRRHGVGS